ncbi:MAG: XrtA system polysaccharide deacetylase [Acidobacteriota bacterium]
MAIRHIMSVDVEDYFQVEAFADRVRPDQWDSFPTRVADNTRRILDLFDEHGVRATFFYVGWVAKKFPGLVAETSRRGHELGCHSYWHRTIFSLTPEQFREDLRMARDVIEQAGSQKVEGFRAPSWSITQKSLWALDVLAEEGFQYDSSIFPIVHDIYGVPGASRRPYVHANKLPEFPPASVRVGSMTMPAAGGGYLRILPFAYTCWAIDRIQAEFGQPVVIYFHPWEIDPAQPRLNGKLRSRFRHYTNLGRMENRLVRLMKRYPFQSFRDWIASGEGLPAEMAGLASGTRL